MLKTSVFVVVCLTSLGWIGWNALELFQRGVELHPELIFSSKDDEVLVVNQFESENLSEISFVAESNRLEMMRAIGQSPLIHVKHIYLSKSRPILLVETKEEWVKSLCLEVFRSLPGNYQITSDKWGTYNWGSFKIQVDGNLLLISPTNFEFNKTESKFDFDALSAFSIIHLKDQSNLNSDFYLTDGSKFRLQQKKNALFYYPTCQRRTIVRSIYSQRHIGISIC